MSIYPVIGFVPTAVQNAISQHISKPIQPQITTPVVNHIPGYVYRLTCIPTKQFYIGSRVGNIIENRMPKDDFWIIYHTSSEYVSELVTKYGKCSFEYEIIYEDCDRDKVFWHEQEQIRLHYNDPLILNKQFNWKKDKHRGVTIQRSNSRRDRRWEVTSPCGVVWVVSNIERYCKDNDLDPETMRGLVRGKGKQYKGFKCRKAPELPMPDGFISIKVGEYIEPIPLIQKVKPIKMKNVVVPKPLIIKFKHKERTESLRSQYEKKCAAKPKPVKKQKTVNPALQAAASKAQETQRNNGTHKNGNKACTIANRKTWEITDPTGVVCITDDLRGFCNTNKLTYQGMMDVAVGRQHSHRNGWKCKQIASNKPPIQWEITDPTGNITTTDNLKLFCENNSLREPAMRNIALGYQLEHRGGWKCKRLD